MASLKDKVLQAIADIRPNSDQKVQTIVTGASIMLEGGLPMIQELINQGPYLFNSIVGVNTCKFCKKKESEGTHTEDCIYAQLDRFQQFVLKEE